MKVWPSFLILIATILISPQLFAHADHMSNPQAYSFINGLAHPFSGADHIITLLLAGALIARFAARKIKTAVSTLSLLMVSYIGLHGTEMSAMNGVFSLGFLASSFAITGVAFLTDKLIFSILKKRHA